MGEPISQAEAERAYAACLKVYGGSDRLELRAGPSTSSK
jgi:hypothetical protein